MGLPDELALDFNGTDVNQTVEIDGEDVVFALDGIPDFGLFQPRENRQDQGVLGMWPVGGDGIEPRRMQFMVSATIANTITGKAERMRATRVAHDYLRKMFSPKHGHVSFGVTTKDPDGVDQRVDILARAAVSDSYRITIKADSGTPGARPSGYALYLVTLDALWPWWRGPVRTVAFDTAVSETYALSPAVGGDRRAGWRLEVEGVGGGTPTGVVVAWGTLGTYRVNIQPFSLPGGAISPIQAFQAFDWFYTRPQDWKSYQHDGAEPPSVTLWGALQPGPTSNSGLADPADTQVMISTLPGGVESVTGTLRFRAYYENVFPYGWS